MSTRRCGNTSEEKCQAKGSREEPKMQGFVYRNTANVEHDICDLIGNNWSHSSSDKSLQKIQWIRYERREHHT